MVFRFQTWNNLIHQPRYVHQTHLREVMFAQKITKLLIYYILHIDPMTYLKEWVINKMLSFYALLIITYFHIHAPILIYIMNNTACNKAH